MSNLRPSRVHPPIDLETIRETLVYMHSDLGRSPELSRVREALGKTLEEIDVHCPRKSPGARVLAFMRARFVPWTPGA